MNAAEIIDTDISRAAENLRAQQKPFAFATIVRTAGSTAAKPGAKALLSADGTILEGWLGGGCARGAVKRAAVEALKRGTPQLISVAPEEFLAEHGLAPGAEHDGITYSRNGCPSRGTVDIFIEPCLPLPELVVIGTSPVAQSLADLAKHFDWSVTPSADGQGLTAAQRRRFVVVATQGKGDLAALKSVLSAGAEHISFVSSRRKFSALSEKLEQAAYSSADIAKIKAPAGLDIHAVTPEEIALSILAELVSLRRAPAEEESDG